MAILSGLVALGSIPPLLIGSVHPPVVSVLTLCATVVLAAIVIRRWGNEQVTLRVTVAGYVGVAACGIAFLQLIPLPGPVLEILSPRAAELWRFVPEGLGLGPSSWRPLTLAPVQTSFALMRDVGALLLLCAAATFLGRSSRGRWVVIGIVASGLIMTLIGVAHWLTGTRRILWFYEIPTWIDPLFFSTFVSTNNMASFMILAFWCAMGLAMNAEEQPRVRLGAAAVALAAAGALVVSESRGGLIAWAVASIPFVVLSATAAPSPRRARRWLLGLGVGGVAIAVTGFLALSITAGKSASIAADAKFLPWQDVPAVVADFPAIGIGRGAWAEVYPAYKTNPERLTFTYIENEPLEWIASAGPIVGGALLLLILLVVVLLGWRLRKAGAWYPGAFAALYGLLVHSFVDFNFQIAGVLFPAALLTGALAARAWTREDRLRRGRMLRRRLAAVAFVVAGMVATTLGTAHLRHGLQDEEEMLSRAGREGREALLAAAAAAIPRHPTDSYLLLRVAAHMIRPPISDPRRAISWINRAMFLNPTSAEPHLWAARALHALGRAEQARIEYKLSLAKWAREDVAREVVHRYPGLEALRPAVPWDSTEGVNVIALALMSEERSADAVVVLRERLKRAPGDTTAKRRLFGALTKVGEWDEAVVLAEQLLAAARERYERGDALRLKARALRGAGNLDGALTAARDAWALLPDEPEAAFVLIEAALQGGGLDEARTALERVRPLVAGKPAQEARWHFLLGRLEVAAGSPTRAAVAFAEATRLAPKAVVYRLRAAKAFVEIGDYRRAIDAYRSLAAMGGRYAIYAERAAELERRMVSKSVPDPGE